MTPHIPFLAALLVAAAAAGVIAAQAGRAAARWAIGSAITTVAR